MAKRHTNRQRITAVALIVIVVGALAATAVAQNQRFSDVPPDHEAYEAVEWAAEVGVTVGYGDGTFKPEEPLIRRHARVFVERFYDDVLGANGDDSFKKDDFTRGDMMVLLKAINDGGIGATRDSESSGNAPTSTLPVADDEVEAIHSYERIQNLDPPSDHFGTAFGSPSESTNVWNEPLLSVHASALRYPATGISIRCEDREHLQVFVNRRSAPGDPNYLTEHWYVLEEWDYSVDGRHWFKGRRQFSSDGGSYYMSDSDNALRMVNRILDSDSNILYIQHRTLFAPPPPALLSTANRSGIAAVKAACT